MCIILCATDTKVNREDVNLMGQMGAGSSTEALLSHLPFLAWLI